MRLRNYRTSILLAVSVTALISAFWFIPNLAFVIFLSLLLQLLLLPGVEVLAKRLPRVVACGIVLLLFVVAAMGILAVVSSSFVPTFTKFVHDLPQLTQNLQHLPIVEEYGFFRREMDSLWSEAMNTGVTALKSSLSLLLSLFNKFMDIIIILFVTFYLLLDGEKIKSFLAGLFPSSDYGRVLSLFDRILVSLRVYIFSQMVICCITGLVVFSYFTLRDLPYASVFAVVSGICEFVPVLGPTVASAFGTLLTLPQSMGTAVQTLGFYVVLTQVNHNIIYPTLIGKSLHLHPIAVILGIVLGGEVLGAAGMFLAVPVIVIIKLVIEDIYASRLRLLQNRQASRWLNRE